MSDTGQGDSGGNKPDLASAATLAQGISLYGEELEPGAAVGLYVLDESVGQGGFARVYRGHHMKDGSPVAVKILHQRLAGFDTVFRRFEQEAETIRRLRHPSIVELLDWGQLPAGRPYMVMEWLEGTTLEGVMEERGAMAIETVLPFVQALCEPLSLLHEQGIVHRDLKPSNIMVLDAAAPRLKLLDFGTAKLLDYEGTGLTSTGARLGTPAYMAPEQILGGAIDKAADIYALGVMLFHMLTGELPFSGRVAVEVHELHLRAEPPRVSDRVPMAPSIDDVVRRCMEKQPAARPATALELYDELVAAAGSPTRPSNRFNSGELEGVGLYVAAAAGSTTSLEAARQSCLAAGFSLAIDEEAELLAVMATAPDAAARALTLASGLVRDPESGLSVRLHRAAASVLDVAGVSHIVGGALLELSTWPAAPGGPGVFASAALAGDLEGDFAIDPVPDYPDIRQIRRR